jgi:magnesium transporter
LTARTGTTSGPRGGALRSWSMLTCHLYRGGLVQDEECDPARAAELLADPDVRLWVDARDPDERELELLRKQFGLHPLSIEDAIHWNQRSKVEIFERYFAVVVHALDLDDDDELLDSEIHLFVGDGFFLTVRGRPVFDLAPVRERVHRSPELMGTGGAFLLYALLDEVVDGYLSVVERLEDLSDDIEDRVFQEDGESTAQQEIFRLKRRVVAFRRIVVPLREVVDLVEEQPGFVGPVLAPYYRDVLDHVLRTIEFVDNIRDLLSTALEAQLAQVSNRLNVVMKKLSSWAAIVLVPTLIAGIYGMNFRHMPELAWQYGYPLSLGTMLVAALLLYRGFRKRGWL